MKPLAEAKRPKSLQEIYLQPEMKATFERWLQHKYRPEAILLIGPPGTGKTSLSLILAEAYLVHSVEGIRQSRDFMIANASDLRGIEFMRTLNDYASTPGVQRVVILDECDQETPEALGVLRGMIEGTYQNILFIITGNNENKFTDAVFSRCTTFKLDPLPLNVVVKLASDICQQEEIKIGESLLTKLCASFNGDMRKILTNGLERLMFLKREVVEGDIAFALATDEKQLAKECWEGLLKTGSHTHASGIYIGACINRYIDPIKFVKELSTFCTIAPKPIAKTEYRLRIGGCDPFVQVPAMFYDIAEELKRHTYQALKEK